MPEDIYVDDAFRTLKASDADIRTVTGDMQRGQQVATIAMNAAVPYLAEPLTSKTILELQTAIRENLLRPEAINDVNTVNAVKVANNQVTFYLSTNIADVEVPIELNR